MLKYCVILLDKTSVAYCHADNPHDEKELMPLHTLKDAIFWAMKENLMIQFVYPKYELPKEHLEAIDTIDHVNIGATDNNDIVVLDGFEYSQDLKGKSIVIRTTLHNLLNNKESLIDILKLATHTSICLTDIDRLNDEDLSGYKEFLHSISMKIEKAYKDGNSPQINLLTDLLLLDSMNNCNAGNECITIAPNGKFYICPAFYYENENDSVGAVEEGLNIKNSQLYRLEYAPICRNCDAYHCHRCVWLNQKTTLEVNTPSRQQCVIAHLERNAARDLLHAIRKNGIFLPEKEISEIDYLDPFDKIVK